MNSVAPGIHQLRTIAKTATNFPTVYSQSGPQQELIRNLTGYLGRNVSLAKKRIELIEEQRGLTIRPPQQGLRPLEESKVGIYMPPSRAFLNLSEGRVPVHRLIFPPIDDKDRDAFSFDYSSDLARLIVYDRSNPEKNMTLSMSHGSSDNTAIQNSFQSIQKVYDSLVRKDSNRAK